MEFPRAPQDVYNVGELTREIKGLLENNFAQVWVRGEISNCRTQASGHVYFALKDGEAQLSAVVFRSSAARLGFPLRDGMSVVVFGRIDVYPPRGVYQLVGQFVVEDGMGRLQLEFERLKRALEAEGLFDAARKQPIPAFARTVGFVTSPTGAVLRDFVSILKKGGWTGRVVLVPARVQGEGAAAEIAAQVARADASGLFDLLVVGRGGGSMEDLWAFNEEALVRAVAACKMPVISAVGHQTDFTLCDFAADRRAETPSAAASLILASYRELTDALADARAALYRAEDDALAARAGQLELWTHRLRGQHPSRAIETRMLRLDELSGRLAAAWRAEYGKIRERLGATTLRFWRASPKPKLDVCAARLGALEKRLTACGIDATLKRGFVLLADKEGGVVSRAYQLKKGERLHARFYDGNARLDVP